MPVRRPTRRRRSTRSLPVVTVNVDRRFYRRLENFVAALIADRDVVPGLRESRPFGADPMSDELRVVFRFLPGPATMPQDIMGRKLSGQIKEELLHEAHNAVS